MKAMTLETLHSANGFFFCFRFLLGLLCLIFFSIDALGTALSELRYDSQSNIFWI